MEGSPKQQEKIDITKLSEVELSALINATQRKAAIKEMIIGGLVFVGGVAFTAYTYFSTSSKGGSYFVMYGAIIIGFVTFVNGMRKYLRIKKF